MSLDRLLEQAGESWDSPYTRLAIVKFCQGSYREAAKIFAKAHMMCEKTIKTNREVPLSLALCTLGSKVIQSTYHVGPLYGDPLEDLERAISQEPKLSLGPLECHRDDAGHLLERRLSDSAKRLVTEFMNRIEEEIDKINPKTSGALTPAPDQKMRILFLAAGPSDASRLRLDAEFRNIKEQILLSIGRERFALSQSMAVRPKDLSYALLNEKPQVVHFSGHGLPNGMVCFEDEVGKAHPVDPNALAELFKEFAGHVFCVILNACYSEEAAKAIGQHIDYVIGMDQEITDEAAIYFAIGFYQALGAGKSLEEAYRLGRVQVGLHENLERLKPILIKDGEVV